MTQTARIMKLAIKGTGNGVRNIRTKSLPMAYPQSRGKGNNCGNGLDDDNKTQRDNTLEAVPVSSNVGDGATSATDFFKIGKPAGVASGLENTSPTLN